MDGPKISSVEMIESYEPNNMKFEKVTIIDCFDSFTHNLVQAFLKIGCPVDVVRDSVTFDQMKENIGEYIVLSPGPGRPNETRLAPQIVKKYIGTKSILGVCLGMQLLNEFYGGRTVHADTIIHGKTSNIEHDGRGIFRGVSSPTPVARYHSLKIEIQSKMIEVQSEFQGIPMAIRVPGKFVAVQFHPESFMTVEGHIMLNNFLEGIW